MSLSSSNVELENSSSRLKVMLSHSRMSLFFMSLGSCLKDCSFQIFSNSSTCIVVLSMIAHISLLRFVESVAMFAIILASILVSMIGNCIFRESLSFLIFSFKARNYSSIDGCRNCS